MATDTPIRPEIFPLAFLAMATQTAIGVWAESTKAGFSCVPQIQAAWSAPDWPANPRAVCRVPYAVCRMPCCATRTCPIWRRMAYLNSLLFDAAFNTAKSLVGGRGGKGVSLQLTFFPFCHFSIFHFNQIKIHSSRLWSVQMELPAAT